MSSSDVPSHPDLAALAAGFVKCVRQTPSLELRASVWHLPYCSFRSTIPEKFKSSGSLVLLASMELLTLTRHTGEGCNFSCIILFFFVSVFSPSLLMICSHSSSLFHLTNPCSTFQYSLCPPLSNFVASVPRSSAVFLLSSSSRTLISLTHMFSFLSLFLFAFSRLIEPLADVSLCKFLTFGQLYNL